MNRSRHAARAVVGADREVGGTVYGTIVVMATTAAGAETTLGHWKLPAIVGSTAVVLWIAHVYSHALAHSVEVSHRLTWPDVARIARVELPIALAAVAPVAVLVLGALDVLERGTAVWVALGLGLATLAVQGVRYAHLERVGPGATAAIVALNLTLGLVIVGVKAALAH